MKDTGWIPAGELRTGDPVKLRSDDYVPVESCDVITLDEPVRVYNFDVADNHTYYVSEENVLVHNDYNNKGRKGRQKKLKEIANDSKVSKTIRGEMQTRYKQKRRYTLPKGYELAHQKGKEAFRGYGYEHTKLQLKANHRNEHKFFKPWLKNGESRGNDGD